MNKKHDIVIVGTAGAGTTVAALSGAHGTPDIIVVDQMVDVKTVKDQEQFKDPGKAYIIEKLPDHVEPFIDLKNLNKHPFDKFINGKRRKR